MLTIDASVFVAAEIAAEPRHISARRFLAVAIPLGIGIHLPWLAVVETAVSIGRRLNDPKIVRQIAERMSAIPAATYHALDGHTAEVATAIGAQAKLRGADAVYAAVTVQTGATLITYDEEMLRRLSGHVPITTPEQWLASRS